jgi:hypothetical protein
MKVQDLLSFRLQAAVIALAFLVVATLAGMVPAHGQTNNINFPAPSTFTSTGCPSGPGCGPSTRAATTGDFNGDGKLDVVNTDSSNNINVMLGNGNGTFQLPIITSFANGVFGGYSLTVGDFNGDHSLDVAVWGAASSSEVHIFLGNGAGGFTTGGVFVAPNSSNWNPQPNSIAAVDVNGDGKLDLVALTPYNGVFVYIGNGDGTFQTAVNYVTNDPNGPNGGLAVGDLNGDGHPDLAITASEGLDVLLNNGNGTFGTAAYYDSGHGNAAPAGDGVAMGDVNGDKHPDVVITNQAVGTTIFLNSGSGTFTVGNTVSVPNTGASDNIVLADINNDKKLDIVEVDAFGDVYTFLGKGTGSFSTGPAYPLQEHDNGGDYVVALGDFNGDGTLDLFTANGLDTSTVALGRGDGSFQTAQLYSYPGNVQWQNIAVADFNGDGFPDVASQGPNQGSSTAIGVVLDSSHGALTATPIYSTVSACANNYVYGIASGDVNGDGKADLVAAMADANFAGCQNHTVAVMLGLGNGKFGAAKYYATGATAQEYQTYLVDVNGDGKLDLVTSNLDGSISVLLNKGTGAFQAPKLVSGITALSAYDNQLAFGDFNGDGKTDIAVAPDSLVTNDTSLHVLPGNGDGTFGSPITTPIGLYQHTLAAGDFNKDGKLDLIVTTTANGCTLTGAQSAYVYLQGIGNGTFTPGTLECGFYSAPGAPVVADLNGDGKLDVVIPYDANTNSIAVGPVILQGKGDGTFTGSQSFYTGQAVNSAAVADFNGDGMLDVALVDYTAFLDVMLNATQPVSVSPLTVNYGSETVGTTKAQTVILTNDQTKSLSITSITVGGTNAGDFSETNNCGTSRKPGWDCTVTVKFTPTATGTRTATLNIVDAVGTQTVQLSGTGM